MAWNGSDQGKAKVEGQGQERVERRGLNTQRSTLKHGVLAGAIVVALGCGAIWWFVGRDVDQLPTTNQPTTTNTITEVKPDIATNTVSEAEGTKEEPVKKEPVDFQATYPRKPGHLPLPDGTVVTFKPPAPGCTTEVYTVGGLYFCDCEGNFRKYEPPRIFDNRFENTLEALASDRMLLLTDHTKNFSKEEVAKYLTAPVEILDDDPPDIVARKTATAAMKDEIKEFIKDGGTYADYIDQLHDKVASERSLHREAMREMVQLMAEGDIEGAREYRAKMDEFLNSSGYMGMKIPDEWKEQLNAPATSENAETPADNGEPTHLNTTGDTTNE